MAPTERGIIIPQEEEDYFWADYFFFSIAIHYHFLIISSGVDIRNAIRQ